ncbi:beta-ketoacyl synthase N-terminal-like domain-containing protein [Sorangium sp. So ce429]
MKGVLVTGMGIVGPFGSGVALFERALREGARPFTVTSPAISTRAGYIEAQVPEAVFQVAFGGQGRTGELNPRLRKLGARAPLAVQAALLAASEALWPAGTALSGERIGIVVGGQNLTHAFEQEALPTFRQEPAYVSPSAALRILDTDVLGCVSEAFGIRGEGMCVAGASASGNVAIIHGARLVCGGQADACLVVGALAELSLFQMQTLVSIGALGGELFLDAPHRACRPFDRRHGGFIPGQASAALLLESAASARARGAKSLGCVLGGGIVLDAKSGSSPSVEGEVAAMRRALADAGASASHVSYVNAHGTGTPLGDEVELRAIAEVLGDRCAEVPVNSTKVVTGHCLWAAGVVEAVATLVQMRAGFVHGNYNLDDPLETPCRLVGRASEAADIGVALSNSFGFGGINTSIVLGRASDSRA